MTANSVFIRAIVPSPSADGNHVELPAHEELPRVLLGLGRLFLAAAVRRPLQADPGILDRPFVFAAVPPRQLEQERLAGAEVGLPLAPLVLGVALRPRRGAVGPEDLVAPRLHHEDRRLVELRLAVEGRQRYAVFVRRVD